MVRERDLARPQRRAAADQAAAEAVWCGARKDPLAPAVGRRSAPARLRRRRLERLVVGERRQEAGRRCASIDLPVPGGPTNSRLCRRLPRSRARAWRGLAVDVAQVGHRAAATRRRGRRRGSAPHRRSPGSSARTTSSRWRAPRTTRPPTERGLARAGERQHEPRRRAARRCAAAPRHRERAATGRSSPSSDSSPANSSRPGARHRAARLAARMPSAIGRSKRPDSFGRSAGARLTVTACCAGTRSRSFCNAARTRSRASLTSVSARPTRVKPAGRWRGAPRP